MKAYRLDSTRLMELIDTPGVHKYTDEMMRGISLADAAVLLIKMNRD